MRPSFFVAVTTCERPDMLWALVQQLASQSYTHPSLEVAVFDDATRAPLIERPDASDLFRRHGWSYRRFTERRGKERFWETYNDLLGAFRASEATHLVTLPDDCIVSGWFLHVIEGAMCSGPWRGSEHVHALNTHVDARNATGCWGTGKPRPMGWAVATGDRELPPVELVRIGWLDGFNAISRHALEKAELWACEPIRRNWAEYPLLGSGVGAQMSARLRRAGVPVYGLSRSLVKHLGGESVMNPRARAQNPLTTLRFLDD